METVVKTAAMPGNLRNARRRWSQKVFVFCFVTAEDGTVGVGEGWTSYASPHALTATIEDDIAPLVVDRELDELLAPGTGLNGKARDLCVMSGRYGITAVALSAVEMALYDIAARLKGLPLWQYLGGSEGRATVYASGGLYRDGASSADLGAEVSEWVGQGHRAVKIKVGGASLEEDVERIRACREAIGPGTALMVDAHYVYAVDQALSLAREMERFDITFFEAPIRPDDWSGHAALATQSPVALCGNETLPWSQSFAQLADAGVRYLMPDVSACGGVTETLAVVEEARQRGGAATFHSSSSVVLFLASLHLAAARPGVHSVEMHMMHQWLYALCPELRKLDDGRICLPTGPGVGIDPADLRTAIAHM